MGYDDDKYANFKELSENQEYGKDYEIKYIERPNSNILFLAIHGGGIEVGTSEVAQVASEKANQTYYEFAALLASNNHDLHLTSVHYDEPKCVELVEKSDYTISVHGYADDKQATALGGTDEESMAIFKEELEGAGFLVEEAPSEIGGTSKMNIANRNKRAKGVQLELSTALRKAFFTDNNWARKNRVNRTDTFHNYVDAIVRATSRLG